MKSPPTRFWLSKDEMSHVMRTWWSLDVSRDGRALGYLVATGVYNTLFACLLTVVFMGFNRSATWWNTFTETLLISQCIGFSIHFMFELVLRVLARGGLVKIDGWKRQAMVTFTMMTGILVGYTIAFGLMGRNFLMNLAMYPRASMGLLIVGLFGCALWVMVMEGQTRKLRAEANEASARATEQALQAKASQAELRALQAQIEPHFLFNTLANVQALVDYEPEKAKRMLEAFIDYLRATLDASRHTSATLADELVLLERYLQVMSVRMGPRLRYHLRVPGDLRALSFAPLLLQPLVENAIKYGLEPKIEGGSVTIEAERLASGRVRISVIDDGVGMQAKTTPRPAGSGMGLANVRSRLQALFGEDATLNVATNSINTMAIIDFLPKNPSENKP